MTDLTASQSKQKFSDNYQFEGLTSSRPFDINSFNKSYFKNKATAIHGSETKGIFKRLANSLTNDLAYPKTLAYAEQRGTIHKLREVIGGSDTIQNQADIEKYNAKSLFGYKTWTHGDVFTASEIGTAVVGSVGLLKSIPRMSNDSKVFRSIERKGEYPSNTKEVGLDKLNPIHDVPRSGVPENHIANIEKNIYKNGYDVTKPISATKLPSNELMITGGHHRLKAMENLGEISAPTKIYSSETTDLVKLASMIGIGKTTGKFNPKFIPELTEQEKIKVNNYLEQWQKFNPEQVKSKFHYK